MNERDEFPEGFHPDTLAVHAGHVRGPFEETAEAIYTTSGYIYPNAAEAEAAFDGTLERFTYSRYGNPTVSVFEKRLAAIEGAEDCYATASGMAAVFNSLMSIVNAGDHIVASRALFGASYAVLTQILPRWGITTTFVDGPNLDEWKAALDRPTAAVLFESPSNPMLDIIDIEAVSALGRAVGAVVIADNVFATPVISRPLGLGADVVVYSGTKHLDGQGRVVGGAVLGSQEFIRGELQTLIRNTGPSISPFNAWVLLKGLETLRLRVEHQSRNAFTLARWLEEHPMVASVRYPFLESHPQHDLARRQMTSGGTVVTFTLDVPEDRAKQTAFQVLDALRIFLLANNLGDAKSLATHPPTTTHKRMDVEARNKAGITDACIRISVGLEDLEDLRADLDQALRSAS